MEEQPVVAAPVEEAPVTETPKADGTLLGNAGTEEVAVETPEQKEAIETENKRLLEADDKTLKPEELAKKQELVKANEESKASIVPEKYEVKIDGVEMDAQMLEGLTPIFKDLKLTNVQVQKLAEAYAPIVKQNVETQRQSAIDFWNKQGETWKAESVKMLGSNAKTDMALAAKALDKLGGKEIVLEGGKKTNELRQLLDESKYGNHPVMLKFIIEAGKLLGEDKFVEGNRDGKGTEASMYDHPTSKSTMTYK